MLKLIGRADARGLAGPVADDVWRVCLPEDARRGRGDEDPAGSVACLLRDGQVAPPGYGLYLVAANDPGMKCGTPRAGSRDPGASDMPGPVLGLGPELSHLDTGDIIYVSADGSRVGVLWKNSARHNGLLLTEQCDNYCLMCSQPPKDRDDAWLFGRARKVISLLPPGVRALSLTGGEPTLHADALIGLLEHCKRVAPGLSLHLLTNGRRFADPEFTRRYAAVGLSDIMAGIPIYAPEPGLHDFIVQAVGAFNETVHGILNLASLSQAVEIRVVVQRHTVPVLAGLAAFIARNLPFVAQVALMGLEMTGLARPNSSLVWADPADYQDELAQAVDILATAGTRRGSTTTSSASLTGACGRTQSARSVTGKTTTWTFATPVQYATHAAASSPQAATASASACARYRDQPAETGTQGTPSSDGIGLRSERTAHPAQLNRERSRSLSVLYHRGVVRYFAWSCRW